MAYSGLFFAVCREKDSIWMNKIWTDSAHVIPGANHDPAEGCDDTLKASTQHHPKRNVASILTKDVTEKEVRNSLQSVLCNFLRQTTSIFADMSLFWTCIAHFKRERYLRLLTSNGTVQSELVFQEEREDMNRFR